ncbi:MAG: DUF3822 family protein [Bacteroidaceae bacterium]|nr:DUF3822 family protein [Bacteroidaceae bacterium]
MQFLRINDAQVHLFTTDAPSSAMVNESAGNSSYGQCAINQSLSIHSKLKELKASLSIDEQATMLRAIVESPVTLMPISEFDESHCELAYKFCVTGENTLEQPLRVFYDVLPGPGAAIIFALNQHLCQEIEQVFGETHYVSYLTPLLKALASHSTHLGKRRIYVNCRALKADVVLMDEQRILLLNSYDIQGAMDMAYYTLNIAQKMGLSLSETPIFVMGAESMREEVIHSLRQFAPHTDQLNLSQLSTAPSSSLPHSMPIDMALHINQQQ